MESQKEALPVGGGTIATIFVIVGSILYSTKGLFAKRMMLESADPGEILALRLVWASPVYLAVVAWSVFAGVRRWGDLARMALLGLWGFWLAPRLNFAGLGRTSAGLERILVQASTAFVILFVAISLRRTPGRRVVAAVVCCYVGLVVAMAGRDEGRASADLSGVALILGGAAAWALFVVGVGSLQKRLGSVLCTSVGMAAACVPACLETILVGKPGRLLGPSERMLLPLVGLVVVGTVVPSFLSQAGLSRVGPVRASILSLVGPAVLPFLASALLQESMPAHQIAGLSVVLASCAVMAFRG